MRHAAIVRERLCTAPTHQERFRYLEQVLIERLRSPLRWHAAVPLACFTATGMGAVVREVAQEAGLSYRRFLTVFKAEVGLPPKLFCRILRFSTPMRSRIVEAESTGRKSRTKAGSSISHTS